MKRAVRWIGVGITAAAAATMLLADVVLADPAADKPPFVTVRFDLLSPAGAACHAAGVAGTDLFGRPFLRNLAPGADVACTTADGRGYRVAAIRDPRDLLALRVDVIIADRTGKPAPMVMVQADTQHDPLPVFGNATALAAAAR